LEGDVLRRRSRDKHGFTNGRVGCMGKGHVLEGMKNGFWETGYPPKDL
jgi:hypothetical protein